MSNQNSPDKHPYIINPFLPLEGRLGSGPRLVGRIGSGVRVMSVSFRQKYPPGSVLRCPTAKNRRFHVPQPTFLFPLETPLRLSRNMLHGWMERQFNACQTPRSMYLSIFNSFRVIRCLSRCVSPKIAIFTYRRLIFLSFEVAYSFRQNSRT